MWRILTIRQRSFLNMQIGIAQFCPGRILRVEINDLVLPTITDKKLHKLKFNKTEGIQYRAYPCHWRLVQ